MKKILFAVGGVLFAMSANAACDTLFTTYSCEAGYYLEGTECKRCPSSGGVYGTTLDKNMGGITSCRIPADTSFSDDAGSGVYSEACFYTN